MMKSKQEITDIVARTTAFETAMVEGYTKALNTAQEAAQKRQALEDEEDPQNGALYEVQEVNRIAAGLCLFAATLAAAFRDGSLAE